MTRIAFVIDPLESLNVKKDSTLAMLWAAQRKGWETHTLKTNELVWQDGETLLRTRQTTLTAAPDELTNRPGQHYQIGETTFLSADAFDCVLMRKDPPFDMNYVNSTYLLEQVEAAGTLVINSPRSLRDCNEKFFTTSFKELLPRQIVASNMADLIAFHEEVGDTVFKPLDGMGGKGIFRVQRHDSNLNVILETLTQNETTTIVGQQYLPEISQGDKRILLIYGEPVPYSLARIPKVGEARGNLAVGGTGEVRPLTARDREIAEAVAPELMKRGLIFTGIDVIGDCLTEVNVTCPTCIREIDRETDLDIAMQLMNALETEFA